MHINVSQHPLWQRQIELRKMLRDVSIDFWLKTNVFSLVWWLELILVFLLWFFWWKRVDKTRLLEIAFYGLMVAITATVIDLIGTESVLWGYPNMLVPLMPPLFVVNFSLLPVIYMLVYQYFSSWKSFVIATLIISFIFAYGLEPLAIWLDIYEMNNWKYLYSLPVYIALALSLK